MSFTSFVSVANNLIVGNRDGNLNASSASIFAKVDENLISTIASTYNTEAKNIFVTDHQSLAFFELLVAYKSQPSLELVLNSKLGLTPQSLPAGHKGLVELANSRDPFVTIEAPGTYTSMVLPYKDAIISSGKAIKKARNGLAGHPSHLFAPLATFAQWKKAIAFIANNLPAKANSPHPFDGVPSLDKVIPKTLDLSSKSVLGFKNLVSALNADINTLDSIGKALADGKVKKEANSYRYGWVEEKVTWQEFCTIAETIDSKYAELTDHQQALIRNSTPYTLLSKVEFSAGAQGNFSDLALSQEVTGEDPIDLTKGQVEGADADDALQTSTKNVKWSTILAYHILGHGGFDLGYAKSYSKQGRNVPYSLVPLELHPLGALLTKALNRAASKVIRSLLDGKGGKGSSSSVSNEKKKPFSALDEVLRLSTYGGMTAAKRHNVVTARAEIVKIMTQEFKELIALVHNMGDMVSSLTQHIPDSFAYKKVVYKERFLALNPATALVSECDVDSYANKQEMFYTSPSVIGWCEDIVSYGMGYGEAAFSRSLPHMGAVTESFSVKDLGALYSKVVMHYSLNVNTLNVGSSVSTVVQRLLNDFSKDYLLSQTSSVKDIKAYDVVSNSILNNFETDFFTFRKVSLDKSEKYAGSGLLRYDQEGCIYGIATDTLQLGFVSPKSEDAGSKTITYNAIALYKAAEYILDLYSPRPVVFGPNGSPNSNLTEEIAPYHSRLASFSTHFSALRMADSALVHDFLHSAQAFKSEHGRALDDLLRKLEKQECFIRKDAETILEKIVDKHCLILQTMHQHDMLTLFVKFITNKLAVADRVLLGNAVVSTAMKNIINNFMDVTLQINSEMLAASYLAKLTEKLSEALAQEEAENENK